MENETAPICYFFFVLRVGTSLVVGAIVGGLLGLSGSAALDSEGSIVLSVPITFAPSELRSVFIDHLVNEIEIYEVSRQGEHEGSLDPSVSGRVLHLRGPSGSEEALLSLGNRLWTESRAKAIMQASDLLQVYQGHSQEDCVPPRCQVFLGLEDLKMIGAYSRAAAIIPESLPATFTAEPIGSGPSNSTVLGIGTAAGAAVGGLLGWSASNLFRRNRR